MQFSGIITLPTSMGTVQICCFSLPVGFFYFLVLLISLHEKGVLINYVKSNEVRMYWIRENSILINLMTLFLYAVKTKLAVKMCNIFLWLLEALKFPVTDWYKSTPICHIESNSWASRIRSREKYLDLIYFNYTFFFFAQCDTILSSTRTKRRQALLQLPE